MMHRKQGAILVGSIVLLAAGGCAQQGELKPLPGEELPVAPFGSEVRPSAIELLELEPQVAPERNLELRRRSEERADDPYDLPPEN